MADFEAPLLSQVERTGLLDALSKLVSGIQPDSSTTPGNFFGKGGFTLKGSSPIYSLIGPDGIKYADWTYDGSNMEIEVSSGDLNIRSGLIGGALGNVNVWSLLGNVLFRVGNQNFAQAMTFQHDGTNGIINATLGDVVLRRPLARTGQALGTTGTISVDPILGEILTCTPTGAITFNMVSVRGAGSTLTFVFTTSGTSAFVMTFGTSFKSTGTLSTGTSSAKVFTVTFVSDGTNYNEICRTTAM